MTIRSVMVSLDGSRFAETALPVATRLAEAAGARLELVMVHEPAMALVPAADVPAPIAPDDVALQAAQREYLGNTARECGSVGGRPAVERLIEGLAGPALVDQLARESPDLMVMATHGRGPLSRFWLGSVADHVMRHTSVPLLLLRPKDGGPLAPAETALAKGLVPLDQSTESEAILGPVTALARLTKADLTLIQVIEPVLGAVGSVPPYPVTLPQEAIEGLRTEAQNRLDTVAGRLRADGIVVSTRVIIGLGVAATILNVADEGGFDFVAMTTHGAGGFRRLLIGSVADKVVRGSRHPVLVVRPG